MKLEHVLQLKIVLLKWYRDAKKLWSLPVGIQNTYYLKLARNFEIVILRGFKKFQDNKTYGNVFSLRKKKKKQQFMEHYIIHVRKKKTCAGII